MDITKYAESEFLNADVVKDSITKKGIILNSGTEETVENRIRPVFLVEIDGRVKKWQANRKSLKILMNSISKDTDAWRGRTVSFSTERMNNGKDGVVVLL
jgi:hypothetical protein